MSLSHPKVKHPVFFLKERKGMDKFNRMLAMRLGNLLGSMYFFYFCLVLDVAELPSVIQSHSVIAWITYVSQTVIQLVALPILSTQSNIQQERKDASDNAVHVALTHIATVVDELKVKAIK